MMTGFRPAQRRFFHFTAGIVCAGFFFVSVALPVLKKGQALKNRIRVQRVKLKKYARILEKKESLESLAADFPRLFKVLSRKAGVLTWALSEIETLAASAGIELDDIRPVTSSRQKEAAAVEIKTSGPMQGYIRFLFSLEDAPSLLSVKKCLLEAGPEGDLLAGVFVITPLSTWAKQAR